MFAIYITSFYFLGQLNKFKDLLLPLCVGLIKL